VNSMLKITAESTPQHVTLKLEGNLTGIWVSECLSAWRAAHCSLKGRTFQIDLTSVNQVDKAGEFLLALLHRDGSRLIASGVLMTALIQHIAEEWPAKEVSHVQ
jgi:ABC-type transporter Mla MlaB component